MTHNPHKNYFSDWQTPPEWLTWVEAVLGPGWFDPCPENPTFDGLRVWWKGDVYCNPPGANSTISVTEWWAQAMLSLQFGDMRRIVWCFFNNEATRHVRPSPWELPGVMVIPKKRVAFMRDGVRQKSPRNWTWFWVSGNGWVPQTPVDCFKARTGG